MQGDGPEQALGEHSMFGKRAGVAGSLLGWRAGVGVKGRLARRGRTGGRVVLCESGGARGRVASGRQLVTVWVSLILLSY